MMENLGELSSSEEIVKAAQDAGLELEQITDLERIRDGFGLSFDAEEYNNDELLRLGIGYGIPGPLSDEQIRREATEILADLGI